MLSPFSKSGKTIFFFHRDGIVSPHAKSLKIIHQQSSKTRRAELNYGG
jgi:hypothetical protein